MYAPRRQPDTSNERWSRTRPVRISGGLVQRQVDLLCKIRFRGSWLYLLILLEFQPESDHFMAPRILT